VKLHSSAFEKTLRRRVRAEIRACPSLRREARRLRRSRSINVGEHGLRIFGLIWFCGIINAAAANHMSPDLLSAAIALWATGCAFNLAIRIWKALSESPDLFLFAYQPVSDQVVFDWQWAKSFRYSLWYLVDFLAAFCLVAATSGASWTGWLAVPVLAVVAWLVVLALAAWLVFHHPHWSLQVIGVAFCGSVLASGWVWPLLPGHVHEWCLQHAALPSLVLPTGWAAHTFRQFLPDGSAIHALLILPAAYVISRLKPSVATLRGLYDLTNLEYANVPSMAVQVPASGQGHVPRAPVPIPTAPSGSQKAGITEIEDSVVDRAFLQELDWSRMELLERIVSRWLSPRERLIVEAMSHRSPEWSAWWLRGCKWLLWGMFIGLLFARVLPPVGNWVLAWAGLAAGMAVLPFGSGLSRAFGVQLHGGLQLVFHSGFPIGYHEIARIAFKIAVIRWLAAIPVVLAYAAFMGWHLSHAPLVGMTLGARGLVLVLVAQPAILACLFSESTSDTQVVSWRNLLLVVVVVGCGLVFLPLSFAVFLAQSHRTAGICLLVNAVVSFGFASFYRWLFERNCFDLIRVKR